MKEVFRPDEAFGKLIPKQILRSGLFYVPSQFALSFSYHGRQFVFNTLTKLCIEAVLPRRATAGGEYDELIVARFLVPEGTDELSFYRSVLSLLKLHDQKKRIPTYIIMPTFGCNARCVYCYQEGQLRTSMTEETIDNTLRFILRNCNGKKTVLSWFGGEPLLREDVIDRICSGLKEAGIEYEGLMVTNGSLITPEIIGKMTMLWNVKQVQVSMDGVEQDYYTRKQYLHYHDNYNSVIKAIDQMSDAGISVQIRCNCDRDNIVRISLFLNDIAERIQHKENISVYLIPLYQEMRSEQCIELWTKILSFRKSILDAGFSCLSGHVSNKLPSMRCMADGDGIVISPDGTLYCCEHTPSFARIGNVLNGIIDQNARKAFVGADKLPKTCENCVFLPDCMPITGCPNFGYTCKDVKKLFLVDAIQRIIDENETQEHIGGAI